MSPENSQKGRGTKAGRGDEGEGLKGDDLRLWRLFTRDIDPLDEEPDWAGLEALIEAEQQKKSGKIAPPRHNTNADQDHKNTGTGYRAAPGAAPPTKSPLPPPQPPQLDGSTEQKLRRGKMPIEGMLDLHGYTQDEAHAILQNFIQNAHASGKRCVLVITGKGRSGGKDKAWFEPSEGILRQKTPQWLALPPLRSLILKAVPAARHHGGEGALYIYLKKGGTRTPRP